MTFPRRASGAFQKPSRGDALRAKHAAKGEEARTLAALYREVYTRDQWKCVVCRRPVLLRSVDPLKRAHPHHIVFRSQSKALRAVRANLCTVCGPCHFDLHDRRVTITGNAETTLVIRRRVA